MAYAGYPSNHEVGANELGDDKFAGELSEHVSNTSLEQSATARRKREAPPLVRDLSTEDRHRLEQRLVRKIDFRLLPIVILMYIMNYLDRNNIASARLAGLESDLKLVGDEYQTSVSILFVGYLLMQALLYSGSLLSGAFSGLIAAGITRNLNGAKGLLAWRWLFIIEGSITVVIAFGAYFLLPNFPRTTKWLTEEERQLAIWRLDEDIGEDDWVGSKEQTFFHGMKLAFLDIKMWILMVMVFCIVSSGSVTNFFPTVVATLGYGTIDSLLLTVPPYVRTNPMSQNNPSVPKPSTTSPYNLQVLCVITAFCNALHADRTGERYFHITLPLYVAVIAFIVAATTTATAPRYFSMMIMVPGVYTGYVVGLGWISNTLPRPPAKRAAALAAINAVSNASSIYASYMYPDSAGPRYVVAMSVNCATAVIAICSATVLRFILVRLNKKLDRGEPVEGAVAVGEGVPGEASKKGFRFLL
ncbi:hypothetical protein MMC20_000526 [Loxospora ochrophaea]|nr:hypothetical protein [Loxospora ochrophaea]